MLVFEGSNSGKYVTFFLHILLFMLLRMMSYTFALHRDILMFNLYLLGVLYYANAVSMYYVTLKSFGGTNK
jgi:hypothetical protein